MQRVCRGHSAFPRACRLMLPDPDKGLQELLASDFGAEPPCPHGSLSIHQETRLYEGHHRQDFAGHQTHRTQLFAVTTATARRGGPTAQGPLKGARPQVLSHLRGSSASRSTRHGKPRLLSLPRRAALETRGGRRPSP